MRVLALLPLLLMSACASDLESGHKLGEFEAFTESVGKLTENHVAAVGAATSVEQVGVLESEYAANWVFLGGELATIQDDLEACDLASGMQEHMDSAQAAIDTMMAEMTAHATAQAGHTTVAECITTEEGHSTAMMGAVDDCLAAHEAMHDGVSCAGEHESGMGM